MLRFAYYRTDASDMKTKQNPFPPGVHSLMAKGRETTRLYGWNIR